MRFLFIHTVDPEAQLRNGATLRVANFCRALIGEGHEAILASNVRTENEKETVAYLKELKASGYISEFETLVYEPSQSRRRLGYRFFFGSPRVMNALFSAEQTAAIDWLRDAVARDRVDRVIVVDRALLFLASNSPVTAYIDFIDSFSLYRQRSTQGELTKRSYVAAARQAREMIFAVLEERFYARRCSAWFSASAVDATMIAKVSATANGHTIPNGVTPRDSFSPAKKQQGRIIFSGNMAYPPNYEAAIWFIDLVFPLILKQRGDVRLVIAGSNPVQALRDRASSNIEITGYVNDLDEEIRRSELYVAPMISGGGFKNKIVEALLAGTYVAATSIAVEFLDAKFREGLLVADDPTTLAAKVVDFLKAPSQYGASLLNVQRQIEKELTWKAAATRILELASGPPSR